jgi:glycine betaine/proline transport system permease protein
MEWLSDHKIPIGDWIKALVDLLNRHAQGFFDLIALILGTAVDGLTDLLQALPAIVVILAIAALAYALHRSWKLALGVVLALLLIVNLGYWKETIETLSLVLWAATISMLVGVPIGIAAAHRPRLYAVIHPLLDLMQTIPTFVYLIPTLILFGLGVVPGLISTIVFAIPAPIRLTHLGVSGVP